MGGYVQYGYHYPYFGTSPQNVTAHPQAQQATGNPFYVTASPIPVFAAGPQMYGYPVIYHPTMISQEYPMVDEKSDEQSTESVVPQMWPMPVYHEDYLGQELVEDINQNPSPLTSSDTPSMLSPPYPIYDNQIHPMELQQQMNSMQIYEPQMLPIEEQVDKNQVPAAIDSLPCNQVPENNAHNNKETNENHNNFQETGTNLMETNDKNTETDNQTIEQLINDSIPAVEQTTEDLQGISFTNNDSIIEKDLNQNVPNFSEEPNSLSTNEKQQLNNETSNVPNPNSNENSFHNFNKTMSWTNQNKKSMASVAVTAIPSSTNKTSSLQNKGNSITPSNTTNQITTTNVQNAQFKNYNIIKTPPIVTENNNDKKGSQSPQTPVVQNESIKTTVSTSSIASTAIPQQLHEVKTNNQHKQVPNTNNNKESENKSAEISPAMNNTKNEANVNSNRHLSPPAAVQPAQNPPSWASLFSNKSNTTTVSTSSTTATALQSANHQSSTQFKKPIAKVFPFEGTSNIISPTPGTMSYSAASAQGLATNNQLNSTNNNNSPSIKTTKSSNNHNAASINAVTTLNLSKDEITEEWSLKFADFLMKYKVDYSLVSLRPRGLTNRSNYCYINAILQALIGCPPFYNLIKSIPKQITALMSEKTNTPTIHAM